MIRNPVRRSLMMKRYLFRCLIPVLVTVICLTACAGSKNASGEYDPEKLTFAAMDTIMSVTVYGGSSGMTGDIKALINHLDSLLSVTGKDSCIYAVNNSHGKPVEIPEDVTGLLSSSLKLCEETGGSLDVSVYPLSLAWGFTDSNYHVPSQTDIRELLSKVDYRRVRINSDPDLTVPTYSISVEDGMMLDLGAVAKGYASDRAAALLKNSGVTGAVLDLGGNIRTIGSRPDGSPWNIAIASPDQDGFLGILKTGEVSVITSGGYERYFEENGHHYCHIIDPSTGYPVENGVLSVTIVAENGLFCDALSTALFVMGPDKARDFWASRTDFDYIMLTEDYGIYITEGILDSFTPSGAYTDTPLTVLKGR